MMPNLVDTTLEASSILQDNLEWMKIILKYLSLSFSSLFLLLFTIWLVVGVLFSLIREFPLIKVFHNVLDYILLPGTLMRCVWRVFVLKKMNYTTEQQMSFSFSWIRFAIRINQPFKSMRDAFFYFYAPAINVLVIIVLIIPGALLFEWLDAVIGQSVFYWIWLYLLLSMTIKGLPYLHDLIAPIQTSVVKTPEFYIFIIFYVLLAPLTLVLWGWGITVIFSLFYTITAIYEVEKISRKETHRLSLVFDKYFSRKEKTTITSPQIIITDREP
ncbi:MAG: hypothetical protein ACTSO7_04055 [Candidatus Heimdallarchaeota archaeon]